jgi:hypothetical protein
MEKNHSPDQIKLPDYLKFTDPHLSLQILDFYLKFTNDTEIQLLKKKLLQKTFLFDKQKDFPELEKNINLNKEKLEKEEGELKFRLTGFLNLIENCNKSKDFDSSSFSLGKKIVNFSKLNF